jgi:hypothetical protein
VTLRTHTQVTAFFQSWDLIQPGLVQVPRSRELDRVWVYGGVTRKST